MAKNNLMTNVGSGGASYFCLSVIVNQSRKIFNRLGQCYANIFCIIDGVHNLHKAGLIFLFYRMNKVFAIDLSLGIIRVWRLGSFGLSRSQHFKLKVI